MSDIYLKMFEKLSELINRRILEFTLYSDASFYSRIFNHVKSYFTKLTQKGGFIEWFSVINISNGYRLEDRLRSLL